MFTSSKSMMCRTPSDSDSGLAWDSENMEEMQAQKSPRLMGTGGLGEYPRGDPFQVNLPKPHWHQEPFLPRTFHTPSPSHCSERKATALILVLDAAQLWAASSQPTCCLPVISLPLSLLLLVLLPLPGWPPCFSDGKPAHPPRTSTKALPVS